MKPGRFDYFRPADLAEAVELKAAFGADASVLAGGQSLVPVLNFRLGRPRALIDIGRLTELAGLRWESGELGIGAMVRQRTVEFDAQVARRCPLLVQALRHVAHPAIRNRGTIGGTVAHADPSAEVPAVVAALGGAIHARSPRGVRRLAASDFFAYQLTNTLEPDEILVEVCLPELGPAMGTSFVEYGRRHGDFALAGVAVALACAADGTVADARIGVCGVAATPLRATEAETVVRGQRPGPAAWAATADAVGALIDAVDESEASLSYRAHLLHGLTERALAQAWAGVSVDG